MPRRDNTSFPVKDFAHSNLVIGNWNFTDDTGAQTTYDIFTVTGDILLMTFAICKDTLLGASSTIELGVSGNTAVLLPQVTGTTVAVNEIWHDATVDATIEQLDLVSTHSFIISNGQDAIMTIATANLTAGDIDFYGFWSPLSEDGNVTAP